MSTIGVDEEAKAHVKRVCKIGQGAACCKYLLMGMAFECAKTDPYEKKKIDDVYLKPSYIAKGDNCKGYNI